MRHLINYMAAVALLLTAALPIQAQDENAAFYIYQNDGHFEGFFYDEVQKISYSKIDTLGVEHEDFVSQEIITADSTYRIMLSAIDSVGFVQPEIIYNPNVRFMESETANKSRKVSNRAQGDCLLNYYLGGEEDMKFDKDMPDYMIPKVGEALFLNESDYDNRFCRKVTSVQKGNFWIYVHTEPLDSITELFHQFITVEEYSHDRQGNMLARRVAGMPELTKVDEVSKARRRAWDTGNWSGDIFDFTITGPVAGLPGGIELTPTISGKLNIKANWNLSFGDTKYIGITSTITAGVSFAVSIDYTFADVLKGSVGEATAIPVPAACPLFELVLAPDCFIKAQAQISAAFTSPKANGRLWSKLEFIDWIPYIDMGVGAPPGGEEEEQQEEKQNVTKAEFSFNGSFQTGVMFPLELKTNKILSKIFDCSVGSYVYIGPELSANLSLDLRNVVFGDNSFYNNFKNSSLKFTPLKAAFETKGKKGGWFSDEEFTLIDSSVDLLPGVEVKLFPDFEWEKQSDGSAKLIPSGNVFPLNVGYIVESSDIDADDPDKLCFLNNDERDAVWVDTKY